MDDALHAGAARRTINPPLGIDEFGGRLFGDPIQFYPGQVTALHPGSEQRALEGTLALIRRLTVN